MIEVKGIKFDVVINRKSIRNIYMRVNNTTLEVSVPFIMPEYKVYQFIESKKNWIYRTYTFQNEKKKNSLLYKGGNIFYIFNEPYLLEFMEGRGNVKIIDKKIYLTYKEFSNDAIRFLYKHLDRLLINKAEELLVKHRPFLLDYGYELEPILNTRIMTSKWGVCYTTKNKINISSYLIHYPLDCLEYIMVHEMTHFIVPNHSKRFYQVVKRNMPDYEVANAKLKQM